MTTLEIGRFKLEEAAPAEYMREQGNAKLDAILAGNDAVFNMSAHYSPTVETAVLVALQTDYAGWAGMKQVEGWLS